MSPLLNDGQRAELAQLLTRREDELRQAVDGLRREIVSPSAGTGPEVRDTVDDGDARMMATLDVTHLHRQEEALQEVLDARERLRSGSYGVCETCEEPIPLARLQARPEARFCLAHEQAWEAAQAVTGRATA